MMAIAGLLTHDQENRPVFRGINPRRPIKAASLLFCGFDSETCEVLFTPNYLVLFCRANRQACVYDNMEWVPTTYRPIVASLVETGQLRSPSYIVPMDPACCAIILSDS